MCFIVDEKNNKPLIATEDMTVYKALGELADGKLTSPYYYFEWKPNKINKSGLNYVTKGTYSGVGEVDQLHDTIHAGFHANIKPLNNLVWHTCSVHEMIIPKGSIYYINKIRNEVVSNRMYLYKEKSWISKIFNSFKKEQ
jgi:hypothetical protein